MGEKNEDIGDIEITPDMVKKKLENLNRFKGSGPDNIHTHVLRETASPVCSPMSMIFKESLRAVYTLMLPHKKQLILYLTPHTFSGQTDNRFG